MFTDMGGNTQSIEQLTVSPFIAELNGSTTKTISLSVENGSHIAWIGFDQSGDYKYFKVDQITTGSRTIENESGSSVEVFENISVSSTTSSSLLLTMTYKAKAAMESEDDPFSASLLIVFDYPETKTIQIQLNGYVQGICDDCRLSPDHEYVYQAIDGDDDDTLPDFELYVCDKEAVKITPAEYISNDPLEDGTEPGTYAFSIIPLTDDSDSYFHFYTADKKPNYVVIDAGDGASLEASIPPFDLPAVVELPGKIDSIPVELEEGTQSICPDDGSGIFNCGTASEDSGILVDVFDHQLNVEPLAVTNGAVDVSVNPSTGCAGFGTWEGYGILGEDIDPADETETDVDLKLIATVIVSESQPTIVTELDTGIDGALIVAVIRLTLVSKSDL